MLDYRAQFKVLIVKTYGVNFVLSLLVPSLRYGGVQVSRVDIERDLGGKPTTFHCLPCRTAFLLRFIRLQQY